MNNQNSSRIVPAMKRTFALVALLVVSALPAAAQMNEIGVLVGGSRRFVDAGARETGVEFADSTFSFSNTSFDIFWGRPLDADTFLKLKVGRIETQVPVAYRVDGNNTLFRRDAEGEVTHLAANVEYRFDEPYGSTGIFAGIGMYQQSAEDADSSSSFGVNAGVSADFPITRRYGFIVETAYHWVRTDFQPRYLTVSGGLRVSF